MPDAFDPYFKWLGIPKADQPPHAYRLLGIELYESDADVISNAADARMAQLKSYQTGKFGAVSQKILNEIAAAKVCLLNPKKKADYDSRLRARMAKLRAAAAETAEVQPAETAGAADAGLPFLAYSAAPARSATRTTKSTKNSKTAKKPAWILPAAIGASLLLVVGGAVAYVQMSGSGNAKPPDNQTASLPPGNRDSQAKPTEKTGESSSQAAPIRAKPSPDPPTSPTPSPPHTDTLPKPQPAPSGEPTKAKSKVDDLKRPEAKPEMIASRPAAPEKEPKETETPSDTSSDPLAETPSAEKPAAQKLPVPDEQQQHAMRDKVLDIFKDKVKAAKTGTYDAWLALAGELDDEGDKTKDDPVARYVLWKLAADSASRGGDLARSIDIADKIQAKYEIDGDELKTDILTTAAGHPGITPEAARSVCESAMRLADAAVASDNLETASRYAKLALAGARRVKDPQYNRQVISREQEIEHFKTRFAAVQKARETLKGNPDDADAHSVVGAWFCFAKGAWDKGLPHLARGSREDLAELAKRELAKPSAAKEKAALADAWWALAAKDRSETKTKLQGHAVFWYKQAVEGLSGLEKRRVENQIAAAEAPPAAESHGASSSPARSYGSGGAKQNGNLILAALGTKITGVENYGERLLEPELEKKLPVAGSVAPCEWVVTFAKPYQLQLIRFEIYADNKAAYKVLVSRDGKRFDIVDDHSNMPMCGWQEVRIPSRPVQIIKLECSKAVGGKLTVAHFEAYCYLTGGESNANSRGARGRK